MRAARATREVAAALAVPHDILGQTGDRFAKERQTSFACNFASNEHFWLVPLDRHLAGMTNRDAPLLDGIGGDVLSAGLFLDEARLSLYRAGRLTELADRLLGRCDPLPFLQPSEGLSLAIARARMVEELARHAQAPNPVASFFFWNRTRRTIASAPFGLLGAHRVHCPYLDPEVFDFLLGLPPELFLDHSFHTETIHAVFPEHAAIPFETKQAKLVRSVWHFRGYAARLMQALSQRPPRLLDRGYCYARLGHMLLTGNDRFFWLIQLISYLVVLEEALDTAPAPAPARRADTPMLPPVAAVQPGPMG